MVKRFRAIIYIANRVKLIARAINLPGKYLSIKNYPKTTKT